MNRSTKGFHDPKPSNFPSSFLDPEFSSSQSHLYSAPLAVKPTGILKEGMVVKQGGRIKTWKKRWCVLTETEVMYYKDEQNPAIKYQNIQGHIEMDIIENVDKVYERVKKKFCFKLVTPNRTFVISAPSEEEMESWIMCIRNALSKRRSLTGQNSTSIDYNSKSLEELESELQSLDEQMKLEINHYLDELLKVKEDIINELMYREIEEMRRSYSREMDEIQLEIQHR